MSQMVSVASSSSWVCQAHRERLLTDKRVKEDSRSAVPEAGQRTIGATAAPPDLTKMALLQGATYPAPWLPRSVQKESRELRLHRSGLNP